MARHTPGPWTVEGPDVFDDYNILSPQQAGAVAAVVANQRHPEEIAANARLIAAAPTLLAACEAILAVARRHTDGSARFDADYLDDLRVAIALAKGD